MRLHHQFARHDRIDTGQIDGQRDVKAKSLTVIALADPDRRCDRAVFCELHLALAGDEAEAERIWNNALESGFGGSIGVDYLDTAWEASRPRR